MKNYTHILFDIDDTIFDFSSAEKAALNSVFKFLGLALTPTVHEKYTSFNRRLWDKIDEGKLTRDQMQAMRFPKFFKQEFGYEVKDNDKLLKIYQDGMATSHILKIHAKDTLKKLHEMGYHLEIISNGIYHVQAKRLKDAGISDYFDNLFISEKMGVMKPSVAFFDYIFQKSNCTKDNSILVGDDLKSDILGANQSKLDSVWYNKEHMMNMTQIHPTFVVDDWAKIPAIVS